MKERSEKRKVLVLDDEDSIREPLRFWLQDLGFQDVFEAVNVEQAEGINLVHGPFDLYLVDLVLPGKHGTCFLDKLLVDQRSRTLIMSGFVDDNVYWMCEHMGLHKRQILSKPIDYDCLEGKIKEICEFGEVKGQNEIKKGLYR